MSAVLAAVARHAVQTPTAPAVQGGGVTLDYATLARRVEVAAAQLRQAGIRVLGLALDNAPAWAVIDLAAQRAGVVLLPLPSFFSPAQLRHALEGSGADAVLCEDAVMGALLPWQHKQPFNVAGCDLHLFTRKVPEAPALPAGTAKITYTSGTTGQPKGVCLAQVAMDAVAASLAEVSGARAGDRHLACLPLPTLLENIGGLYAPLLLGACSVLAPLSAVGLSGASGLDPRRLYAALREQRANSAILVPAQLQGLLAVLTAGVPPLTDMRYLAVGGAAVSPRLLEEAAGCGLPVYQGYGLSECASVVAVNSAGANRLGAVGKPLPHVQLEFAADGEIRIGGAVFLGYLGGEAAGDGLWDSGDLGYLDADGFLHLTGRKKNMFITAFGRNVAPEWVEAELTRHRAIPQAAVFGEARPWNAAVIASAASDSEIDAAIAAANAELPDYARIRRWLRAATPFTPANGQATANGRPRRQAILDAYGARLDALYATTVKEVTA
ncbi:AMP-binding protein [Sulfurivermis fontis]|uniref:AMP-binding protein n=1 Tax=Sulfurivermis fontis TaxID=1972068 RepID=UPI000FDBC677|nr:AMP-binding protein [Sulfurivermis fontis]